MVQIYTLRAGYPATTTKEKRPGTWGNEGKCECHQYISDHTRLHIHTRHIGSNTWECVPSRTKGIYLTVLATKEGRNIPRHKAILANKERISVIGGTAIKVKIMIIPFQLQKQILHQLQSNYMGIEKIRLLVCESVYWLNMNTDIENTMI